MPAQEPGQPALRLRVLHAGARVLAHLPPRVVQPPHEVSVLAVAQAHSTLRYAARRAVVAQFAADRLGLAPSDLLPQLVAHSCLGAALTAYEQWLQRAGSNLAALLDEALRALDGGWAGTVE